MSKHLIQTVLATTDSTTRYCIKHGATTPKWRTVSLLNPSAGSIDLTAGEDADSWVFSDPIYGDYFEGYFQFGTCCIWKATIRFNLVSSGHDYSGSVYVNGAIVDSFVGGTAGETIDMEIDLNDLGLMNNACGCQWSIFAGSNGFGDPPQTIVEIIDVTFGPPV